MIFEFKLLVAGRLLCLNPTETSNGKEICQPVENWKNKSFHFVKQ